MPELPTLNFGPYPIRIILREGKPFIYCILRKKNLVLTPEEWVRQHVIHFLITEKKYPRSLIKTEGGLKLNTLQKRSDLLVYNSHGKKVVLVECKAPSVKITQQAFDQIARYNFVHKVPVLMVSNGLDHYYCRIDHVEKSYRFLQELPEYGH